SLSGSYAYASCMPQAPASCLFGNRTIVHGDSVVAFPDSAVSFGMQCTGETRTCADGVLSGSARYESCVVDQPAGCLFNNQTYPHGAIVKAYQSSTVPFGQSCVAQDRVCTNGSLSGSYAFGACEAGQPQACMFNGQTIAHGQKVPQAFFEPSVPYGQTCASEERTCTNGTLSGSASNAACVVGPAASCIFNGQTVNHGGSVQAYPTATVPFGQTCVAQTRTCTNGTLSGSASNASCTAQSATYSWSVSDYGACSAQAQWTTGAFGSCQASSCTSGSQTRSVSCVATTGEQTRTVRCLRSDGQNVADSSCAGQAKPAASRSCTSGSTCTGSKPATSQTCTPSTNVCKYSLTDVRTVGACGTWTSQASLTGQFCSTPGSSASITWKAAAGSYAPNGTQCTGSQGAQIRNTYECKFCPSGNWTSQAFTITNGDINYHGKSGSNGNVYRWVCNP
nr:hypothetical protein [Bdellovibrionales bacterium]